MCVQCCATGHREMEKASSYGEGLYELCGCEFGRFLQEDYDERRSSRVLEKINEITHRVRSSDYEGLDMRLMEVAMSVCAERDPARRRARGIRVANIIRQVPTGEYLTAAYTLALMAVKSDEWFAYWASNPDPCTWRLVSPAEGPRVCQYWTTRHVRAASSELPGPRVLVWVEEVYPANLREVGPIVFDTGCVGSGPSDVVPRFPRVDL